MTNPANDADAQTALPLDDAAPATEASATRAVARAFGEENRARLLSEYFDRAGDVTAQNAWVHTYRLLLWTDRTTGLAHCYESDKSQPGRPWYARSLAFHAWLSDALGVPAASLGDHIDELFRRATADLAAAAAARRQRAAERTASQREPYGDRSMPLPGEDPELEAILLDELRPYLTSAPPPEALRRLTERIQQHIGQENKRKNLVGEGFEDTIAGLLRRIPAASGLYEIRVRPWLHDLPGFRPPRQGSKPRQVDLALIDRATHRRKLVSCKWSVRSDREEQFFSDFRDYAELEDAGEDFDYVLVTNEFDPARLAAACSVRSANAPLFTDVVHVNTEGPGAVYAADTGRVQRKESGGIARTLSHIQTGRLVSLEGWITKLCAE
ncbi:hypothetical protein [Trujillonella humicola]|uniref:hypothetical protein n=1 Tax=Trujillonella humicola TaxID=3383699 RepID=UPI003905CE06